jgi:hypothetical protein
MAGRGGSCRNPFGLSGGRERLDRLDLLDYAASTECLKSSHLISENFLRLACIQDAVHQYLSFGLGNNHTTAEYFYDDWRYLFVCRSDDPRTWAPAITFDKFELDGALQTRATHRTRDDMMMCCFDRHFELSWLAPFISMDRFLQKLRTLRRSVLEDYRQQVWAYLDPPPQFDWIDVLQILTDPVDVADLAALLTNLPRPKREARRRIPMTLDSASLFADLPVAGGVQ